MRIRRDRHFGVVVGVGVIVQHRRAAEPLHLPVTASIQEPGVEPEEGFVTLEHIDTAVYGGELVSGPFLVGDTTALGHTPTPEWARVEDDQTALRKAAQEEDGLARSHSGGLRHPLLAGDPDAPQGMQHDEVGVGSMWLIHRWALRDSNPRLLPCKGSALAN